MRCPLEFIRDRRCCSFGRLLCLRGLLDEKHNGSFPGVRRIFEETAPARCQVTNLCLQCSACFAERKSGQEEIRSKDSETEHDHRTRVPLTIVCANIQRSNRLCQALSKRLTAYVSNIHATMVIGTCPALSQQRVHLLVLSQAVGRLLVPAR